MSNRLIYPDDLADTTYKAEMQTSEPEHKTLLICTGFKLSKGILFSRTWFEIIHRHKTIWIGDHINQAVKKYNKIHSSYKET
jgi:hypothetical protein